ncbi:protein FAM222B [Chanos chanos]|uniref:Protein FAM222B n=1 Tax=Chanos chanos TaxID=29144 RepID=A0A6J2WX50_CHACN|nr:protein FAM222B-like [Chanos chanos]
MLACLPGPGDLSLQLLSHTQMNTGLQKWDTTQRMRSAQYPSPAELDAYAKKVANNPLTIKIFPNSVKVPQRNHVRRTVNGLDTSGPRYSPYPPFQATAKAGLLAIVKVPIIKGIVKEFDGTRARLHPEVIMNAPSGPYAPVVASASTLNLHHHPAQGLPRPPQHQQQGLPPHPQALQPLQPGTLQQGVRQPPNMAHHAQGLARPQALSHPPPLGHPGPQPQPAVLLQQQHLSQAPPGLQAGGRKLPEVDAPPNVTVSTSTIPLSMAGGLHQGRQSDLSSIVHQINQFCQARAQSASATSMCEGQIANPSPISRNLLINASSRVSMNVGNPAASLPGLMHPSCGAIGPPDKAAVPAPPHSMGALNRMSMYHDDNMKQHQQNHQQQQQLQHQNQNHQQHIHHQNAQQQQQQHLRTWSQQQMAHLQHINDRSGHPCKHPSREPGFACKGMNYPQELCMGQPYSVKPPLDKPTPSPPVVNSNSGMPQASVAAHYANGQYFHQPPVWNSILPTPNSDSSGSQDLAGPFHGGSGAGSSAPQAVDCVPQGGTAHYRPAGAGSTSSSSGQTNLMQTADYMGGDFQTPCFRDQNLGLMGKMHRPPMGRPVPEAPGLLPGFR